MTQPRRAVCGQFVLGDYKTPALCDTHYDEAFQNFINDCDDLYVGSVD